MSGIRRMEEHKKGKQIPLGGTSNEKSTNMQTGGKKTSRKKS